MSETNEECCKGKSEDCQGSQKPADQVDQCCKKDVEDCGKAKDSDCSDDNCCRNQDS